MSGAWSGRDHAVGVAAPILLRRHGIVVAWVLASAMRIAWHLPTMLSGHLPWVVGIVGIAAFTMVMLQVFTASGGRWTPMAVWHASLNAVGSGFFFQMVTGEDNARLGYLLAAVYVVVAAVAYSAGRHRTVHQIQPCTGNAREPEKPPTALVGGFLLW